MTPQVLDDATLTHLRRGFTGTLVTPGEAAYDETRSVFNSMIDRHPSVIALCDSEADVARAVHFARERGLPVAVRGGGHSVAGTGTADDGLVVDLRQMNGVRIDPASRTARVGGGAVMSDLDRAAQPYGLATTGGRVSTTGIGGFVLGGGSGWLDRTFGLACDNLLAAEVITADGELVHTSAHHNPELFWALHGGGGNFGVVTSLTLKLHPLPAFTVALLLWPQEAGPEVVRAYRDFIEGAADELGGGLLYLTAPEEEFVPEHLVGRLVCAVLITYTGSPERAREVAAPMLELGHEGQLLAELPYADLQCMLDDPPGLRNYWSAEYLDAFPDEAVDLFCDRAHDMVSPSPSQHVLFPQGGAVDHGPGVRPPGAAAVDDAVDAGERGEPGGRGEPGESDLGDFPLPWRHAPWIVHPFGVWEDPADDERARRWARGTREDLLPWSSGAVYLNFIGQEGRDRLIAGFGEANYRRLAQVKARYDPENVFRINHNIKPA